ncbi:MAG: hypothetical protein ACRDRK_19195 [Pseudonocardia sp.]
MAYVHGHPRRLGWVLAHYRRPNRPGDEQLTLVLRAVVPGDGAVVPDGGGPAPRVGDAWGPAANLPG